MNSRPSSPRSNLLRRRPSSVSSQKPVVPQDVRPLLGSSWIIDGEDPELYEDLLAQVGSAERTSRVSARLLLRQIEPRRSGWAKEVKRASEEVIDAEYSATPPIDFRPKDFSRAD